MKRLKDSAATFSVASVVLGLAGVSVIVWTNPESRLPVWGVYFLVWCLAVGAFSFLVFGATASWIAVNWGLAGQASSPSSVRMMQPAPRQEPVSLGRGLMRIVGRVMAVLGGLGGMYFAFHETAWAYGFHERIGKLPFPSLTTQEAAKGMFGLCFIIMGLGYILISRSRKKLPDSDADTSSSKTKPNPNL